MQRTTWECDRCHRQYFEGDERRPNTMNDLPDRWRQVFKGGNLTYELCEPCGDALKAFCEGHALVAGVVEPVKLSAAVLRLQQMHARIAPFSYRPKAGTAAATSVEHELSTVVCEVIELLLEAVEEGEKPAATMNACQCGHGKDKHPNAGSDFRPLLPCQECACLNFKFVMPDDSKQVKAWPCECGHGKDKHPAQPSSRQPCSECDCFQFEPAVPPNG